ncbi:hypothetical protein [Candidatus Methylomirabilis sp.]|uniref:hypothetical protein n=1 Tax=Candidatus Methylomirabilis sp. TaxID=2032687 RepID=UPI002A5F28BD|nr:hypothetical protein [Candidatus Methylomirabilis sp.]
MALRHWGRGHRTRRRFAALRRQRKLSQTRIAVAIVRIEHNAGNVTIETLLKVPRVLGSSLDIRLTAA